MTSNQNDTYTEAVGLEHRKLFGQFFTAPEIATFMCRWILESKNLELYDPAFGLGVFYHAAKSIRKDAKLLGSEIDKKILTFLHQQCPEMARNGIEHRDYLLSWGQAHSGIVCNPPYMRFQLFENRAEVFSAFVTHLGIRLLGYTNTASAFLVKSLSELREGGRLAYIMPLEFLNTGYGEIVKEQLLKAGVKYIIRLDCEKEAFPDATTSVGIILVEKDSSADPVRFYTVQNLDELPILLEGSPKRTVPLSELNPEDKWLRYFEDWQQDFTSLDLVRLEHYGAFSRGIATGANEFFSLTPSRVMSLDLPPSKLIRCITKSSQVRKCVFTEEDLAALEAGDASIFLLNCNGQLEAPELKYIRYGEERGYHTRYLTKMRTPWYKLEKRSPSPLLFGVFSREKFKVIRNLTNALNLTCYHGFYPNLFGQQVIDALFLYFQSRAARQILSVSMRRYGDGLEKFEPNDLNASLAPSPEWIKRLEDSLVQDGVNFCKEHGHLPEELEIRFESLTRNADKPLASNQSSKSQRVIRRGRVLA